MDAIQALKQGRRMLWLAVICSALLISACAAPATPAQGGATPQATAPATAPAVTPAPTVPTPTAQAAAPAALSEEMLKNAEYRLPDVGTFRLRDGLFAYQYGSGATQVNKVAFSQAALGDLDGDGTADAAVILALNTGGTGTFIFIAAMVNGAGEPRQAAVELLGDRVQVQKLAIKDGRVTMDVMAFAAGDPMCCPSQLVTRSYRLDGSVLKVVSEVRPTPAGTAIPAGAAEALRPAPGLDASLSGVRFDRPANRCDGEPARTMADQVWQANAVEEGGYGTQPAKPGQKVTVQLRNKLGDANAQYQVRVIVIAPNGSAASADAPLKGNDLLRLDYPQAFSGAQATTPGTYTVIWQVNGGFITCWGWEVK